MSKNTLNVLTGLFIILASGFATWLLLPSATAPVQINPLPNSVVVPIGPLQVNLMLVVLLVAGGVPAAGIAMGLFVRWLSSKVPQGASSPSASPARKPAGSASVSPAAANVTESEDTMPLTQKLGWLALIVLALGGAVLLLVQVLPPGFTLF